MHHTFSKTIVGAVLVSLAVAGGVAEAKTVDVINDIEAAPFEKQTVTQAINETIRENCPSVVDIEAISEETDEQWVRERIASYCLPQADLYSRGKQITEEERQHLLDNCDLDGEIPPVGYGVAVRRANVKGLPTGRGLFLSADDTEHDVLQQGTLDPCETVRLLHVSRDGRFCFVQGRTIYGWVFIGDIAFAKKSAWLTYHEPTGFVTVISRGQRIKHDEETVYAQMGTRLPLLREKENEYKVVLPVRGEHGKLVDVETKIDKTDGFAVGYLDCTTDNVAKLAEAYVGAPYGYRGHKNSEDNDGMITDIYRTMGIVLPRDAGELNAAVRLLPTSGEVMLVTTTGGENALAITRGSSMTIIGKTAGDKTIGTYTLDGEGDRS